MASAIPSRLPSVITLPNVRIRSRNQFEESTSAGPRLAAIEKLSSRLGQLLTSLERLEKLGSSIEIEPVSGSLALSRPDAFTDELRKFGKKLDEIFSESSEDVDEELLLAVHEVLSEAISDSFSRILNATDESILRSPFGIDFDFRDVDRGVFALDSRRLSRSLDTELTQLRDFLFRESSVGREGVVVSLIQALGDLGEVFKDALNTAVNAGNGNLVDLSV